MNTPGPDARDAAVHYGGRDATPGNPGHVWVEIGGTRLWWTSVDAAQRALHRLAADLDHIRITPN